MHVRVIAYSKGATPHNEEWRNLALFHLETSEGQTHVAQNVTKLGVLRSFPPPLPMKMKTNIGGERSLEPRPSLALNPGLPRSFLFAAVEKSLNNRVSTIFSTTEKQTVRKAWVRTQAFLAQILSRSLGEKSGGGGGGLRDKIWVREGLELL